MLETNRVYTHRSMHRSMYRPDVSAKSMRPTASMPVPGQCDIDQAVTVEFKGSADVPHLGKKVAGQERDGHAVHVKQSRNTSGASSGSHLSQVHVYAGWGIRPTLLQQCNGCRGHM
jgi:hypothetical protein